MFKSKIYKGKNKLLNDIETEMQFVENKKVTTEIKKNSFESQEITNVNKIDFRNYLKLTFDENLEDKDTEENKQEINKEIDYLIENKKNQLCFSCIIL